MSLKPRLEGKVAIVTGAGSQAEGIGNGRATAILFAPREPRFCSWIIPPPPN